jgi:DNA-binding HxlR family transcriptional regulator
MNDRFEVHLHVTPTLFIGKWMVRILLLLEERPYRRGKLRRRLGTISQRMLTRTLRNLESSGLISRKITRSRSVTVEYSLTKLGRSFMVPLNSVCRWIDRNRAGLSATIRSFKIAAPIFIGAKLVGSADVCNGGQTTTLPSKLSCQLPLAADI